MPQPAVLNRNQADGALVQEHRSARGGRRAREIEVEPPGAARALAGRRCRLEPGNREPGPIVAEQLEHIDRGCGRQCRSVEERHGPAGAGHVHHGKVARRIGVYTSPSTSSPSLVVTSITEAVPTRATVVTTSRGLT